MNLRGRYLNSHIKDQYKTSGYELKNESSLLPFSIFGVSLLGLVLLNNEPRRVTPPYIKESREDSIKG